MGEGGGESENKGKREAREGEAKRGTKRGPPRLLQREAKTIHTRTRSHAPEPFDHSADVLVVVVEGCERGGRVLAALVGGEGAAARVGVSGIELQEGEGEG